MRAFVSNITFSLLLLMLVQAPPVSGLEIEPFRTTNRSPLVQIYGLPAESSANLVTDGRWQASLTQDIASLYSTHATATEQILLDGELYRWNLIIRYGVSSTFELGLELPFVFQREGVFDNPITDWHTLWGLPQGGRDSAPKNRLNYRYTKNGVSLLDLRKPAEGIADISLLAGYKLFEQRTDSDHDILALRSQLKLPTGDSSSLLGSGGVDFSLFLTGSMNRTTEWGTIGVFASAGGMYSSKGDILTDQREKLIGFGTGGLGWSPVDWANLKAQCLITSPFYKASSLTELNTDTALLTVGGTLKLPSDYLLDIGVSEDIAVATAPDVTFHLGLSKRF